MGFDPFAQRCVRLVDKRTIGGRVDDDGFLEHARRHSEGSCVALLSGRELDCSRYSILGWDPFLTMESKGLEVLIRFCGETVRMRGDPIAVLENLFDALKPDFSRLVPPFSGGAMGYLAYDLKNHIERLPETARDDLGLPDIYLIWPKHILVHDRVEGVLRSLEVRCEGDLDENDSSAPPENGPGGKGGDVVGALQSNMNRVEYLAAIAAIRNYIREGDVYQVNFAQRFELDFKGSPFEFWTSLYANNPAPFYAFVNAGSHQVVSTSMERFLYADGSYIESRPIKGTRKRGGNAEEDEALREELLASSKDDAELSMIVDLLRNDLGRICQPRTVRVDEHKRLEAYKNVHHLISIVSGKLRQDASYGDIIRATFPGGSITGCPKIRAMEIIDELEPHVRHVYTGSIGYLGWHENLDLNIAIRTATIHGGKCRFSVGGGIVYDSNGDEEYKETLDKGRTFFEVLERFATQRVARADGLGGEGR
ncbi:MAG: aminodeoxychorismate synthase component I [Syntrophobacteraceae bacterium]